MARKISFRRIRGLLKRISDERIERSIEGGMGSYNLMTENYDYTPYHYYYGFTYRGLSVKAFDLPEEWCMYHSCLIRLEFKGKEYVDEDIQFSKNPDEEARDFYLRLKEKYERHQDELEEKEYKKQERKEAAELRKKRQAQKDLQKLL